MRFFRFTIYLFAVLACFGLAKSASAANVFYSVGQNATDHKTGTPTVTIASGVATFSVAQTATNMGVGDRVTYNTNSIAYIASKTSTTVWNLVTVTGGVPADITNSTVVSIAHEYTSLSAAEAGATDANHLNTTDLVAGNYVLNIPCYYDSGADTTAVVVSGYTTGASNYIKIYTPNNTATEVNQSQRHSGKWNDTKFSMQVSNNTTLKLNVKNVRIEGLQAYNTNPSDWQDKTIWIATSTSGDEIYISHNIARTSRTTVNYVNGITVYAAGSGTAYIFNNIIYDIGANSNGIYFEDSEYTAYVYNNTIFNSAGRGYWRAYGTVYAKNNIAQNCANGFNGTFAASSDYNISDLAADAPGANSKNSTTVSFSDAANKDFHLSPSDTAAKNAGADLSADANLVFNTDIDGQTRSASPGWDIGADEAANAVFYSVGQNATDHKTGSPTVTIASGVATFSVAQTATNMGVGDRVTYNTNSIAYIASKTSTTVWNLVTATGGAPADITNSTVVSIAHEYTSLSAAEAGATDANHLNTTDLVAGNYVLNLPCYYDTGADTTTVVIDGYATGVSNYIKIYTPSNVATEANQSQRHNGKWNESRYLIQTSNTNSLSIRDEYVRVEGLQLNVTAPAGNGLNVFEVVNILAGNEITLEKSIIKGFNNASYYQRGIFIDDADVVVKISNNIIFDFNGGAANSRLIYPNAASTSYIYNNTLVGGYYGIRIAGGNHFVKNNIVQGATNGYTVAGGSFDASSTNNISNDNTAPGSNPKNSATVSFSDSANKDFHLSPSDTAAKNAGADLSADPNLAFNIDIENQSRPNGASWDIGADEAANAVFYSVGQNTTDHKTGTPTVTIASGVATFSVAQTASNMGVGDRVTYNSNSIAYISQKISTTQWNVTTGTGGVPADVTGQSVDSIAHSFSSLSAALPVGLGGASGGFFLNTKDLYTNNFQLNIACYYDSGTDTTAVTVEGWTTEVSNYIRIYTPNNIATEVNHPQRHSGKWDDGRYNLAVNGAMSLYVRTPHVRVDGLQLDNTRSSGNGNVIGIGMASTSSASDIQISNNILKKSVHTDTSSRENGIESNTDSNVKNGVVRVWNNIFYNFNSGYASLAVSGIYVAEADYSWHIYNNTFYGNYVGINKTTGAVVSVKNNIVQNSTTAYSGAFDASSTNNIANDSTAPGSNPRNSTTVFFFDSANKDFHLSPSDTAAKNAGADLSADANLVFNTDIDGQTRSASPGWDIGADEAANAVFYSVGQNATDHKTGSPTVTIASGVATFSVAQTATNMGVGDRVTYNTNVVAYIASKTSTTVWNLVTATGGTPADITNSTVVSIAHEYTSLSAAEAGATDANHLNTTDLVAGNYVLNIPCYYDSGADTTAITLSGYTTGFSNYIKMYAPNNTVTEINQSQRHVGKWDDGKYRLEVVGARGITVSEEFAKIDGLQIKVTCNSVDYCDGVQATGILSGAFIDFSNNILTGVFNGTADGMDALSGGYNSGANTRVIRIWNNVIYDWRNRDGGENDPVDGIRVRQGWIGYVYNNTVYNSKWGIYAHAGTVFAKNNLAYNNENNYYGSSFDASSTNNLSGPSLAGAPGSNPLNSRTVYFANAIGYDFHLSNLDVSVKGAGTNLYADTNLPVMTDVDGQGRPTAASGVNFDVGADQGAVEIFYSVGQNTDDHKTGSPTITISNGVATFSEAQTATNMGVGDKITYNTTSVAYITRKIDQSNWGVQTATGAVPANVAGQTVNSIAHAYASLSAAKVGAADATHLNTSDLIAGNFVLSIPCYYDSGPDTTNVTLNNYVTGSANYMRIYTPYNTENEVNQSQRHAGKWDESKYYLENSGTSGVVIIYNKYVYIDGLQIKKIAVGAVWANGIDISTNASDSDIRISNNIIRADLSALTNYAAGISYTYSASSNVRIWNNIFYDWTGGSGGSDKGIAVDTGSAYTKNWYAYNNTFYNCEQGITRGGNSNFTIKNNIVQGAVDGYAGTFTGASDYNISDLAADAPGANAKNSTTVAFVDAAGADFHLAPSDTAAKGAGVNLSTDANLLFYQDVDGKFRPDIWDIGADQSDYSTVNINSGVNFGRNVDFNGKQ